MDQEFVIYIGIQDAVIIRDAQLTKPYRLDRGQGVIAANENDRRILLSYKEMTGCCGNRKETNVVYTDEQWCKWQNFDLSQMRKAWANRT